MKFQFTYSQLDGFANLLLYIKNNQSLLHNKVVEKFVDTNIISILQKVFKKQQLKSIKKTSDKTTISFNTNEIYALCTHIYKVLKEMRKTYIIRNHQFILEEALLFELIMSCGV